MEISGPFLAWLVVPMHIQIVLRIFTPGLLHTLLAWVIDRHMALPHNGNVMHCSCMRSTEVHALCGIFH